MTNMRYGHIVTQPGCLVIWISIAGITPRFHLPEMKLLLRNKIQKKLIKLAGLDSKDINKTTWVTSMASCPSYSLPSNLMPGVQRQQIKVKKGNKAEFSKALEAACKSIL